MSTLFDEPIESCMRASPSVITPDIEVGDADRMMRFLKIRHLPVVERSEIVGVVSERDLRQALALSTPPARYLVRDVMARNAYCVTKGTPVSEVTRTMAERKLGCAIVMAGSAPAEVAGIFTTTDALIRLSQAATRRSETLPAPAAPPHSMECL